MTAESCPLATFIKVVISNDVRHLKTAGIVKRSKLTEAWESIFDQYLMMSGEKKYQLMLRRLKDMAILRNRVVLAISLLKVLELRYNENIVKALSTLGYRGKFDRFDKEGYRRDLDKVNKMIKNDIQALKEMEETGKKGEEDEIKETDFDNILAELSRFQGYRLDKEVVTVSEYVHILNRFKEVNQRKHGK